MCGRGPCDPGFFDFDGDASFGCEASCDSSRCVDGAGNEVELSVPPLAEAGPGLSSFVAAGSLGSEAQTSPRFTNQAALGEPTPPLSAAAAHATSRSYRNLGGLSAGLSP